MAAVCSEPGCPAIVPRAGYCRRHRRYSPTTRRSAREIRRRAQAVADWVAVNGWVCPGWHRDPHESHDLTADHVTPVAWGGGDGPLTCLCRSCNSRRGASMDRG
jgi:hypothetical protein